MKNEIENILLSQFVGKALPFDFITIEELYNKCHQSNYDLSIPHRIKFHALIVILEGESTHTIDFKEEILSPGVIIPLTKDQVHAFNSNLTVKGLIISFEENFITQNISEQNLFHFLHIYHTPSILLGKENLSTLNPFLKLLEHLHLDTNLTLKSEIIHSAFFSLLFQIKRFSIYQHKTFESTRFKDFIRYQQLITQYYPESHNVTDYAQKLAVSYKYINDICKQIGNKTAKSFLDNYLLLEAKRNISENKYTSQEIAYKMGFKEPANFIRFFKRFTKMTPNQFQKSFNK